MAKRSLSSPATEIKPQRKTRNTALQEHLAKPTPPSPSRLEVLTREWQAAAEKYRDYVPGPDLVYEGLLDCTTKLYSEIIRQGSSCVNY